MTGKDELNNEDVAVKHHESDSVNEDIVAAAVAAAAKSVLHLNTANNAEINPQSQRKNNSISKKQSPRKKSANVDSNIESHFQEQIQTQLQDQIQDELRLSADGDDGDVVVDDEDASVHDVNLLDSTNIDDELRNLEKLVSKDHDTEEIVSAVSYGPETENGLKPDHESAGENVDNENLNVAIDVINKLESMGNNELHMSKISKRLNGKQFYLPIETKENESISAMIATCGGETVTQDGANVFVLVPSIETADLTQTNQYLYQLIYDVFTKKTSPSFAKYKVNSDKETKNNSKLEINVGHFPISKDDDDATDGEFVEDPDGKRRVIKNPAPVARRKSKKFTKEEDDFILDLVRRNPHLRSTHTFFARISQLGPLSEHTGNSIRYRYRKILAPTLNYVYKIDPSTGKPEVDPATNEPLRIEEIPSLIKAQYTAEEDYLLCRHILSFKRGEMPILGKKNHEISHIPEAVFQEINKSNPRHSGFSWRDRYRKFAAKYGLTRYVTYFEDCIKQNIKPEPMKNMSSRADRKDYKVDVFENETKTSVDPGPVTSLKRSGTKEIERDPKKAKYIEESIQTNASPHPEIVVQKETSNGEETVVGESVVDPLLESESVSAAAGALKALADVSIEQDVVVHQNSDKTPSIKVSKVPVKGSIVDHNGANLFVDATEDEMKQYDIALDEADIEGIERTDKKKDDVDITVPEVLTHPNDSNHDVELINVKADDGLMDFRQLLDIDPEPLKHRDEIDFDLMISNIQDCFRKFGDGNTPYELFKDISDQTGISMLWLNYWFDCSCGMLGTFIQAIIHYLESGELVMNNVSGFWTEKDDELLKIDPENKDLLELHGKDSVTKRKAVLLNYVL